MLRAADLRRGRSGLSTAAAALCGAMYPQGACRIRKAPSSPTAALWASRPTERLRVPTAGLGKPALRKYQNTEGNYSCSVTYYFVGAVTVLVVMSWVAEVELSIAFTVTTV